jgi:hypothetical protein
VTQGQADLGLIPPVGEDAPAPAAPETEAFIAFVKTVLGEDVSDVRASDRLTTSAACLVASENGIDRQLERLLAACRAPSGTRPVLELNPRHDLVTRLAALPDAAEIKSDGARLLLDEAHIADGELPTDARLCRPACTRAGRPRLTGSKGLFALPRRALSTGTTKAPHLEDAVPFCHRLPIRKSAVENVVVDLCDADLARDRTDALGMEEQRAFGRALPAATSGDQRNADRTLPHVVPVIDRRQGAVMDERELRTLKHDAAIGRQEAAGSRAGHDHAANGQLTGKAFAAGFEIDRRGQTFDVTGHTGGDRVASTRSTSEVACTGAVSSLSATAGSMRASCCGPTVTSAGSVARVESATIAEAPCAWVTCICTSWAEALVPEAPTSAYVSVAKMLKALARRMKTHSLSKLGGGHRVLERSRKDAVVRDARGTFVPN